MRCCLYECPLYDSYYYPNQGTPEKVVDEGAGDALCPFDQERWCSAKDFLLFHMGK
jgi:hypothetical protein